MTLLPRVAADVGTAAGPDAGLEPADRVQFAHQGGDVPPAGAYRHAQLAGQHLIGDEAGDALSQRAPRVTRKDPVHVAAI